MLVVAHCTLQVVVIGLLVVLTQSHVGEVDLEGHVNGLIAVDHTEPGEAVEDPPLPGLGLQAHNLMDSRFQLLAKLLADLLDYHRSQVYLWGSHSGPASPQQC